MKSQPRALIELDSPALLHNYQVIQKLAPHQFLLPMLKADAYGHGMQWVAQALSQQARLYAFGVATLEEGAKLRSLLGASSSSLSIIVFAEGSPWTEEKGHFCLRYGLTAVISSQFDWQQFLKYKWHQKISYELQFNTGTNRLGIEFQELSYVKKTLKTMLPEFHPQGIFSHLAMSETPQSALSQTQLKKFQMIKKEITSVSPQSCFHLANSGAIWNIKEFGLEELTHVSRLGLSLYGVRPWLGAPAKNLIPVMTFKASVVAIHRLNPGDSIGYGGTYKVKGSHPIYAAILAAGYADGVKRSLSNLGYAWLDGEESRFLGVVSMDLCAIQCQSHTKIGSWAELWGTQVDAWQQAHAGGTIPYELFVSVSSRVKRVYL